MRNKILVPNSVHTWPREENSEKNFNKKKKIKKPHSGIISSQNGMRLAEKEKKKLVPNSVYARPELENSKKNKKVNSGNISIQNGLKEAVKERKKF